VEIEIGAEAAIGQKDVAPSPQRPEQAGEHRFVAGEAAVDAVQQRS
jgi:hypothetical protein